METIRIRVSQVLDFGKVVTVVGTELGSNKPVAVHVDYEPFQTIWDILHKTALPQPVPFEVDRLMLCLDLNPDESDDANTVSSMLVAGSA